VAKLQGWRAGVQRSAAGTTIPRALAYITVTALAVLFLWLTLKVVLVIFAGVLLAVSLRRTADHLSRLVGLGPGLALATTVLLICLFFALAGWLFANGIASQMDQLSRQLPAAVDKLATMIGQSDIGKILNQHISAQHLTASPASMIEGFLGAAINLIEVVGGIVVVVFLGLYFAAEAGLYSYGLLRLVAPARRARAAEILGATAETLWRWMLGRLFAMAVLGALVTLGLWIIGVPLPIALGLLAALFTFVPYIGAFASAVPSVLIAGAVRLDLALYVIVLYLAIHLAEGYVLVPLVQRRVVHLPPALTLSAQILLGVLAGFLGLLLATPIVAGALVLVRMIYVEDVLGDRDSGPGN
jgi:predicted PurR-regulated permease PerM